MDVASLVCVNRKKTLSNWTPPGLVWGWSSCPVGEAKEAGLVEPVNVGRIPSYLEGVQ